MQVRAFNGLNNVTDAIGPGWTWQTVVDNVDITASGAIQRREGYTLAMVCDPAGRIFSTFDRQRAYIGDGLALKAFFGTSAQSIAPLTTRAPISWAELNSQVLFVNGADSGIIQPDNEVVPWRWTMPPQPVLAVTSGNLPKGTYRVRLVTVLPDGRVTGHGPTASIDLDGSVGLLITNVPSSTRVYISAANSTVFNYAGRPTNGSMTWNASPDQLGKELLDEFQYPLPAAVDVIAAWRTRIYAGMYMPANDQTVIWWSKAFAPHLFDLTKSFITVPGRVLSLIPQPTGLVIGTDREIHAYDGKALAVLARYGMKPGRAWDIDTSEDGDGRAILWTARGFCAALPFSNLTAKQISVAPGTYAGGALIERGGQKRFVALLHQGGKPFNSKEAS